MIKGISLLDKVRIRGKYSVEVRSRFSTYFPSSPLNFLGPDNAQAFSRRVGKVIVNRVPANAPFAMRLVQTVGKCLLTHNESVAKPIRDALGPLKTSILSQSLANLFAIVDETFDQEEKKAAIIVEKVGFDARIKTRGAHDAVQMLLDGSQALLDV